MAQTGKTHISGSEPWREDRYFVRRAFGCLVPNLALHACYDILQLEYSLSPVFTSPSNEPLDIRIFVFIVRLFNQRNRKFPHAFGHLSEISAWARWHMRP